MAQIQIEPKWLSHILWTDEAYLTLNDRFNTQNCGIWSVETSQKNIQEGLHGKKVTV